ncbi:MAG: hypothetical protein LBS11_07365 [Oscillospiraceae bacterium]|jgi:hypothetical protein|nr:hypothetical protein [Oscillospiraceae bacterium]
MEYQLPPDTIEADLIITETTVQADISAESTESIESIETVESSKPRKNARKPRPSKPDYESGIETLLRKVEENQLALESRIAIEHKTIAERFDYRFNRLESLQKEASEETRRAARDIRAYAAVAVIASLAVVVITLIR